MSSAVAGNASPRRSVSVLLAALGCAVLLSACGSDDDAKVGGASSDGKTQAKVAYFTQFTNNGYLEAEYQGVKKAVEATGGTVKRFDPKSDANTQISQIQTATNSGQFNGFVIDAVSSPAVVPAVKQAIAKGIKVVAVFAPVGTDLTTAESQVEGLTSTVALPSSQSGADIGELALKACGDKPSCEVAYIAGNLAFPYEKVRLDSFKEALAANPNIEVVAEQEGLYMQDKALAVTQNILQANPGVDVIASAGDQMTAGAGQAVDKAGKSDQVALIGNAASEQGVAAVKDGTFFGTALAMPFTQGEKAGEILVKALNGEEVPTSVTQDELSPLTDGSTQLTKENVGDFKGEWAG
jgi:ribose transport system substrate-binding protein